MCNHSLLGQPHNPVLIKKLKKLKKKSFGLLVACLCVLILLSDQSSNLLKYFFERLRPCHDDQIAHLVRLVKQNCGGLYSFFSAHASNSFALATFFYFVFKKIIQRNIIFFFLLAALIGYSRIYIGVHYPLDVISGSVFGFISGFVIFRFWVFSLKRINGFNS